MSTRRQDESSSYLRQSRTALIGIFILCIVAAIYLARDILMPVVFAFFIAMTFRPTVRKLAHYNVPPWAAATGFVAALVLVSLTVVYLASGPIAGWIADAPQIQRSFMQKVGSGFLEFTQNIQDATTPARDIEVQEVVVRQSALPAVLSLAADYPVYFFVNLTGTLVIAVFLMASGDLFYEKLVRVLPTLTDKKNALRIVHDVEHEVSAYLLTVTAINLGVGIAVGILFQLLGMPSPHLWALFAFVLNFIPYIGPIAGLVLSALVSVVVFDSLLYSLLVPFAYGACIGIETQVVSPAVLSRRLQINAVAILLALAFWGWAWGIPGIIIALPVLVTVRVFCSHLESLAAVGEFLSESSNDQPGRTDQASAPP